jgi:hypothetical protein
LPLFELLYLAQEALKQLAAFGADAFSSRSTTS